MELLLKNGLTTLEGLDPARTAVLAIHWQNDLVEPEGGFGPIFAERIRQLGIVPRVARVLDAVRNAGGTVIYVNVAYNPGHPEVIVNSGLFRTGTTTNAFVRGTPGVEVTPALRPVAGDFSVEHSRISAFYGNDIELILRKRNIDTIAVTGVATNVAVDHTVRDAVQLGYNTIVLEDCCCSSDQKYHDAAMLTLKVLATFVMDAEAFVESLR